MRRRLQTRRNCRLPKPGRRRRSRRVPRSNPARASAGRAPATNIRRLSATAPLRVPRLPAIRYSGKPRAARRPAIRAAQSARLPRAKRPDTASVRKAGCARRGPPSAAAGPRTVQWAAQRSQQASSRAVAPDVGSPGYLECDELQRRSTWLMVCLMPPRYGDNQDKDLVKLSSAIISTVN